MSIILYDLVGTDDRRFSPNTWRSRLALAHKGLDAEIRPTRFLEIAGICGGNQKTVPVIEDGDAVIGDSWAIAKHLEDTYPDHPSLFGGAAGRALTLAFQNWVLCEVYAKIAPLVVADICGHLDPEDGAYFRQSREKRFGMSLEDVQAGRDDKIDPFRKALHPARMTLRDQPFMGGDAPLYADYVLFAALLWPRVISPFQILTPDDPVYDWFERCLDLHDGLARTTAAYDW